ncbi:MAG: MFS transporter [Acidobacteria bacterium]|nr:MFS transporter [Acidobacteriota bacterium]
MSSAASAMRVKVVGLMFGLSVMSYFDRTILAIATPGLMKEFALSEIQMGLVSSAFLFSYAILMTPGGWVSDLFGPRRVLTGMALGSGLFTALMAWAGRPGLGALMGIVPGFVLIRLGLGVCTAPLYPACGRTIANWMEPGARARAQGIVNAGAGLGGAVSPVLFTWMIARYGWRASFVLSGLATVALGLLWLHFVRDRPPGTAPAIEPLDRPASLPWRTLLTDRNLVLLTIGYFAVDYFEYIFFYWIFYYLSEIRGLGAQQSAWGTTVLFLAWLVMTPAGGWVSDRMVARYGRKWGLRMVGATGLALAAVLLFAGTHAAATPAVLTMLSLALGFASCADVTFWTATIEISGEDVGAACGILNTGGNVGGFFAPIVTAWIASRAGWSWGLYFGALVALVGMVSALLVDSTRVISRSHARQKA